MFKSDIKYLFIIFSILLVSFGSCGDEEPVKLTRNDKLLIDSLFFAQKDSLVKLSDSLCDLQYQGFLNTAIDSIKTLRREEIEFILGKK